MKQAKIKRIIGKICISILIVLITGLISGFVLEAGLSIIQTLGILLGIVLLILITWTAVYWGGL